MKKIVWAIVVILIIAAIWYWGGSTKPAFNEPIKVGVIYPQTGSASAYGIYSINALKLAVADFNAGDNGLKFEMIYEDGKCDGQQAVTAMNKLISVNKVKYVIGGFCSGETLAIAPIAESNKVLLLSAGSGSPDITKAGDYVFRTLRSDDLSAKNTASVAINRGDKEIGLIAENLDYPVTFKKAFASYYTSLGGKVTLDDTFNPNTTDFRNILTKAKANNVKAILLVTQSYRVSELILKQMVELKYSPKIYASEATISKEALNAYGQASRDLLEGAIFTEPKLDETSPKTAKLLTEYAQAYGTTTGPIPTTYLATHYDAVYLLGEAIRKVGDNPTKVKNYFYTIKNWSGTIGNFSFDKNGDAMTGIETKIVRNGNIVSL